jgi:hypothetical protein
MSKLPEKKQSDKAARLESKLPGQREGADVDAVAEEERRISGMMKDMGSVKDVKINVKEIVSIIIVFLLRLL